MHKLFLYRSIWQISYMYMHNPISWIWFCFENVCKQDNNFWWVVIRFSTMALAYHFLKHFSYVETGTSLLTFLWILIWQLNTCETKQTDHDRYSVCKLLCVYWYEEFQLNIVLYRNIDQTLLNSLQDLLIC